MDASIACDDPMEVESRAGLESQILAIQDQYNEDPSRFSKKMNLILGRSVLIYSVRDHERFRQETPTDFNSMAMILGHQQVIKNWSRHLDFSNFFHRITEKNPEANPLGEDMRKRAKALINKEYLDSSFYERLALVKNRQLFQEIVENNNNWPAIYSQFQRKLRTAIEKRHKYEVNESLQKKRNDLVNKTKYLTEFITRLVLVNSLTDKDMKILDSIKSMN